MIGGTIPPVGKSKEPDAKPVRRARYRGDGEQRTPFLARIRPDIMERMRRKAERQGITLNALLEEVLIAAGFGKPEPDSKT